MTTQTGTQPVGYALQEGEGEARWWLGSLAIIKATARDTEGRFTLIEMLEPEGADGPLHVHHREDEGFWVLEGELTFRIGDATIQAGPGSFVYGPKGVPHTYRVDRGPARLLFVLTPAGFEDLVMATSEPAPTRTLPPASDEPPSEAEMAELAAVVRTYGAEILEG